jgi:hypothetical protein
VNQHQHAGARCKGCGRPGSAGRGAGTGTGSRTSVSPGQKNLREAGCGVREAGFGRSGPYPRSGRSDGDFSAVCSLGEPASRSSWPSTPGRRRSQSPRARVGARTWGYCAADAYHRNEEHNQKGPASFFNHSSGWHQSPRNAGSFK